MRHIARHVRSTEAIGPLTEPRFRVNRGYVVLNDVQNGNVLDPQTGQPITETKSFLNLSPRNVVAGYDLDAAGMNTGVMNRLQQPPAALLSSPY